MSTKNTASIDGFPNNSVVLAFREDAGNSAALNYSLEVFAVSQDGRIFTRKVREEFVHWVLL